LPPDDCHDRYARAFSASKPSRRASSPNSS
jgi:hypothetical protein